MKYRKLRIAWSVAWGGLAVLLSVLWVRSYWWADIVEAPSRLYTGVLSAHGSLRTVWQTGTVPIPSSGWGTNTISAEQVGYTKTRILGFGYKPNRTGFVLQIPYWFLVLSTGGFAALTWLRWPKRFSLRTLLIAMTLVAVGLGMIVWMSQPG